MVTVTGLIMEFLGLFPDNLVVVRHLGVAAGVIATNNADAKHSRAVGANYLSTVYTALMVPMLKSAVEALSV